MGWSSLLSLSFSISILSSSFSSSGATASPLARNGPRQVNNAIAAASDSVISLGNSTTIGIDRTFDYVVIGAGTAGLTIAARLAETPGTTVAVIEPGTFFQISNIIIDETPAGDVLFTGSYTGNDPLKTQPFGADWKINTVPQRGANNREIHVARGRGVGGSSGRNFMIFQRPTKQSLDLWAQQTGDETFKWDAMQPYFQKSVTFNPPDMTKRAPNATAAYDAEAFTASGPLQLSYANYAGPFSSWMEDAFRECGIGEADGFNSGNLVGSTYCASTISKQDMKRATSQTSFYNYARDKRLPLTLYTGAMAKKILFNADKVATGVAVQGSLNSFTLSARKEVILSAGAYQSPQLLMVSGVGPAATLAKFNIPLIKDAPGVGQNMQDHIFFGPTFRVHVDTFTKVANNLIATAAYILEWGLTATGPMTNPVCDYLGWEKVPQKLRQEMPQDVQTELAERFPEDWPEIEYLSGPGYVGDFEDLFSTQPKDGYQYATILAALVAPTSRGTVTISSDDANELPVVDPNWFTTATDQAVGLAAFKRAREFFASKAMAPVLADTEEYFPGVDVTTDEQILDIIRENLMTVWHPSCTCKMGPSSDEMAVVDSQARVYGVKNLRVVDASAFALLPPGHPQSMVYALAEKIADDIKTGAARNTTVSARRAGSQI